MRRILLKTAWPNIINKCFAWIQILHFLYLTSTLKSILHRYLSKVAKYLNFGTGAIFSILSLVDVESNYQLNK